MDLRVILLYYSNCRVLILIQIIRKTSLVLLEVQVGKDQEKAQSEKDSHSKNRGGKKPN